MTGVVSRTDPVPDIQEHLTLAELNDEIAYRIRVAVGRRLGARWERPMIITHRGVSYRAH